MSQKLNGLVGWVLRLLVVWAAGFPHESEDQYEARMYGQWGMLYLAGLVECYVMDKSQFVAELRHVWADGSVWWVKLFGLDYTEGTYTLYVGGLSWQWERWLSPEAAYAEACKENPDGWWPDDRNHWAIEYSLPLTPNVVWYTTAGSADGLGVMLRDLERKGAKLVRLMRMSAYLREIEAYRAFQAENNRYWACAEYFPGTGNVSRTWVVRSPTRPDDPNEDGDLVYPFNMGGRVTAGPFETQAEAELAACDHFMEND